jgi:hypothetical protein
LLLSKRKIIRKSSQLGNILAKGSIDHNILAEGKTFLVILPKEDN